VSRKIKVQKDSKINKSCCFQRHGFLTGMVFLLVFALLVCGNFRAAPVWSADMPVVIVDPGHGGNDKGGQGPGGQLEKQVCLALAKKLEAALDGRAQVIMTRTDDYGISVDQRASLANRHQGDALISLHTGASPSSAANKHCIYYDLPPGGDQGPAAADHDSTIARKWDRIQYRHVRASALLAESLRAQVDQLEMPGDADVMQASMALLHGLDMPAVIYETGYITHPTMAEKLENQAYLESLARALAEGTMKFLRDSS
jgi:N-acetylmuramoyl-L-alanine amidase